jgi:hypothetical protein
MSEGGMSIAACSGASNPDGTLATSIAEPIVCERDLRVSMGVMVPGMAYMLATHGIHARDGYLLM